MVPLFPLLLWCPPTTFVPLVSPWVMVVVPVLPLLWGYCGVGSGSGSSAGGEQRTFFFLKWKGGLTLSTTVVVIVIVVAIVLVVEM